MAIKINGSTILDDSRNLVAANIVEANNGVEGGYLQGHRDFSCLVDFASNPAGTWLTLVDVVSASGNYTTVGFTLDIIDNNGNHAPSSTIDTIDRETYYVHCCRTEATTANVPDACYVRGPSNRIRAVKTAVGVYEIQIQNDSLSREYRVDIKVHGTSGTHTVNYRNGDAGSTGTAQYNASVSNGGNKEYFNSVSIDPANSTGLFIDGSGITISAAAIAVAYDSTITGQGNNRTLFAHQGKDNYIRGNTTYLSSDLQGVGATYSSTVNASTFNATSTTNGGFQGIDADTAGQPSFTWSGDQNTGIWHVGENQIGFATGGINKLTISTTAITSSLDMSAPTFNATSATNGGFQGIDADTASQPSFTWSSDQNTGIWHAAEGTIGLTANGTSVATVNTTGLNIISGALSTPTTYSRDKLRVWNTNLYTIGFGQSYSFGGNGSAFDMTFQMNNSDANAFWWGDSAHTNAQGAMSLSTKGHLSVATAARIGYGESDTTKAGTNATLDVGGSIQCVDLGTGFIDTTELYVNSLGFYQVAGDYAITTPSAAAIIFGTNSTDRFYIGSGGNIGIGNTAPLSAVEIQSPNSARTRMTATTITAGNRSQFVARGNTGTVTRVGEIGVYRNTNTAYNPAGYVALDQAASGTATYLWFDDSAVLRTSTAVNNIGLAASGTVVGSQTSDERLKNIEQVFPYGLDTVKALTPIKFQFVNEDVDRLGFGAQTTSSIVPESVYDTLEPIDGFDEVDTKLAMEYTQIIPVLVAAIQELSAKVEALEAQLNK